MTYIYAHLAFYMLLVSYGGPPEYGYRINGGYDSCLLAQHIVTKYDPTTRVRCISGIEWDKTDRPGRRAEVAAP